MMLLISQDYLKTCPVESDLQDDDWCYIICEFALNYSMESIRYSYNKSKETNKNKVNADVLRELGYSEEDIAKSKF